MQTWAAPPTRVPLSAPHGNTEGAMPKSNRIDLTRRELMRYGGSITAATVASLQGGLLWKGVAAAGAASLRQPDSLPNPKLPAGTVNEALPFDHIVVVMMENHSFDNLLGALRALGPEARRRARVQPPRRGPQQQPGTGRRRHGALVRAPDDGPGARGRPRPGTRPTSRSTAARWTASSRSVELRRADGLLDRGRAAVRVLVRAHASRSPTAGSARRRARPTPTAAS